MNKPLGQKQRERRDAAIAMKVNGKTYREIAVVLGVSRQRVQQIIAPPAQVRHLIFLRCGDICESCGKKASGKDAHLHHVARIADYNAASNLAHLCNACHRHAHGGFRAPKILPLPERLCEDCGASYSPVMRKQTACSKSCSERIHSRFFYRKYKNPNAKTAMRYSDGRRRYPPRGDATVCL